MTPLFSVILLYFILFLYGEFSKYDEVRYTSRLLFYGLSANLALLHYLPSSLYTGLLSGGVFVCTILYIGITTTVRWFRAILLIPATVLTFNYYIAYTQPVEIITLLPEWYLLHSDKIFREGFIFMLGILSYMHGKQDEPLNYAVMLLYAAEYTITMER